LFCIPGDKKKTVSTVFRLFSELHLREMIVLDKKFKDKEAAPITNLQFALADVYSVTMFQHFINESGFACSVYDCISS
jgi:5-methylcytosine-specific restriction endonuclease McrBC regulatory subunit McrC